MARSGEEPGRGSYVCSNCGGVQELKTATARLKACPSCGGRLFRNALRPRRVRPVAAQPA